MIAGACNDKDDDTEALEAYAQWREANDKWLAEEEALTDADGNPFYEKVYASKWAPRQYVLMHWFNDRSETAGNLTPLVTSTVSTRYKLHLYNDTPADSSMLNPSGVFNSEVGSLINGWQLALQNMKVGDSVQIIVPYVMGYGASTSLASIPPFSVLRFNMRLVDIPAYEVRP